MCSADGGTMEYDRYPINPAHIKGAPEGLPYNASSGKQNFALATMYSAYPPSSVYPVNRELSHKFSCPARQYRQMPQVYPSQRTPTRSSKCRPSTPVPIETTLPTTSCPRTSGSFALVSSPSTTWRSVRQIPQAITLINTWSSAGLGAGRVDSTNGCFGCSNTIARMAAGSDLLWPLFIRFSTATNAPAFPAHSCFVS